jgi:two-component system response regulator YesN
VYKVFFVDDEAAMRAGLRDSISRDGSGFSLVGEAPDGEMALSLIAETLPDILITDVKMPFMDGIELSRRVARTMPWVKIIILSGHDEFEYAKQAIKIGVSEYLLKPVTSSILFQALETAAKEIAAERERRKAIENLQKAATDARRLQTEKFLSNLLYGITEDFSPDEKRLALTDARCYQTTLIEIIPNDPDDGKTAARACSSIFAILAPNENVVAFPEGAERIVCVYAANDEDALEEDVYATAQAVKYDSERNNPCLVSVAIGLPVKSIAELPQSMSCAKKAMRYLEKTGRRLILGFKDMDPGEPRGGLFSEPKKPSERGSPPSSDLNKTSRYCDIIKKSREYISAHYAEQSISLNTVAESVGLSPNHFSTVFSQETGETFIECLTRTRLRKAQDLLKSTQVRASEIAYMVGYNDPHYFSYVFKKNVGMSPSEFRK